MNDQLHPKLSLHDHLASGRGVIKLILIYTLAMVAFVSCKFPNINLVSLVRKFSSPALNLHNDLDLLLVDIRGM